MKRTCLRVWISLAMFIASLCFLSAGNQGNLQIAAISPEANSVSVSRETSITVEFDRPVDINTVDLYAFSVFGRLSGAADGTFHFAKGNRQVTFTPKRPFSAGELVEIFLSHDIADTEGVPLRSSGYTWSFWAQVGKSGLTFHRAGRLSTGTNVMAILFGDGEGNLSEPVPYRTGSSPASVSLGDLDGDGSLDVVVSNFGSSTWTVFTNDGTGQLTERLVLRATRAGSCAILHDIDGDGDLDITGVDELEDELILWENV